MTWDDFVEEYYHHYAELMDDLEGTVTAQHSVLSDLEEIYQNPININIATREQLLSFPFVSEAQVDSILLYRKQRKIFRTLGEFQVVTGLDYATRCRLSLFVYAGDTLRPQTPLGHVVGRGKHEIINTLHLPLYKRMGYRDAQDLGTKFNPNSHYIGSPFSHTLRYRYKHYDGIAYGLTLQTDEGEPIGKQGFYPYDYISAYAKIDGLIPCTTILVGDFEVNWGTGLLMGNIFFNSPHIAITQRPRLKSAFRPHTSAAESEFMRGVATSFKWKKNWQAQFFVSYDKRDATLKNDTVTSFKTDGLHRNYNEIMKRRTVGQMVTGARTSFHYSNWHIGASGYYAHYNKYIYPSLKEYNRYYLRGQHAAGASLDGLWQAKRWTYQGEIAIDQSGHIATTHLAHGKLGLGTTLTFQGRYFSPRYIAPFANTLQMGSHVQNETGIMVGTVHQFGRRWQATAYADYSYHPRPMYRADTSSMRFKCSAEGKYSLDDRLQLTLSYRFYTKQQNVTGYDLMEYIGRHQLQMSSTYTQNKFQINAATSFVTATSQTSSADFGFLVSSRGKYTPIPQLSLQYFCALFFTEGYSTRIYAYEPQLKYSGAFPTFAYHGMRWVGMIKWEPSKMLSLTARYGLLHYFNRESISSGTQEIPLPTQNDIWIQLGIRL